MYIDLPIWFLFAVLFWSCVCHTVASLKSVLLNLVCVNATKVCTDITLYIFIALETVLVGDALFMLRSNQPRILFPSSGSSNLTCELVLLLNGGPSCVNHSVSIVVSNTLMLLCCIVMSLYRTSLRDSCYQQ